MVDSTTGFGGPLEVGRRQLLSSVHESAESSTPSADPRERSVLVAIAVVALLTLAYSVLVAQQILAWFAIAIPLVLLYPFWRFVRAHERIADALEG